ncbi:MAG: flagellin [Chloroflexi bacterium]|nr:flagellin [Chloroflexota bacterium]
MTSAIGNALTAQAAVRQLGLGREEIVRSAGRLSTGLRVRHAADDAAALQIATGMRSQLRGLGQSAQALQNGISLLNIGDGALTEALGIVQRMRELAVAATTSIIADHQRRAIGAELFQLRRALDNILDNTQFNEFYLFRGAAAPGTGDQGTVEQSGGTLTVGLELIAPEDGPGVSVAAVNVTQAQAGKTYTLSASGTNVTITSSTGESQSVTVAQMRTSSQTPQALNFNALGIIITLEGYEGPPAVQGTGPNIAAALAGKTITTTLTGGGGGVSGTSAFVVNPPSHGLMTITINRTQSATVGAGAGFFLSELIANENSVSTVAQANTLFVTLDVAMQQLLDERGRFGGQTNRIQAYLDYVLHQSEQIEASLSRIVDADMAEQVVTQVRAATLQDLRTTVTREALQLGATTLALIQRGDLQVGPLSGGETA